MRRAQVCLWTIRRGAADPGAASPTRNLCAGPRSQSQLPKRIGEMLECAPAVAAAKAFARRRAARLLVSAVVLPITIAPAPVAVADDHETVGGGTFAVANSHTPCTDFRVGGVFYTACPGSWINLPPKGEFIVVPLGSRSWVSCDTYAPNGQLFEHDDEYLAEVPEKQRFWAERGWGVYEPKVMCQIW